MGTAPGAWSSMDVPGGSGGCPPWTGTRVALLALAAGNGLSPGCMYTINDHVQGNLVLGTLVSVWATDVGTIGQQALVKLPAAQDAWHGIYDFQTGFVTELQDNLGNVVRGRFGTEVANFPWLNPDFTANLIENASLIVNPSPATPLQMDKCVVANDAFVDLQFCSGFLYNTRFIASTVVLTTNSLNITSLEVSDGSFLLAGPGSAGSALTFDQTTITRSSTVQLANENTTVTFARTSIENNSSWTRSNNASGFTPSLDVYDSHLKNRSRVDQSNAFAATYVEGLIIENDGLLDHRGGELFWQKGRIMNTARVILGLSSTFTITLQFVNLDKQSLLQIDADINSILRSVTLDEAANITLSAGSNGAQMFAVDLGTGSRIICNPGADRLQLLNSTMDANSIITNDSQAATVIPGYILRFQTLELQTSSSITVAGTRQFSVSGLRMTSAAVELLPTCSGAGRTGLTGVTMDVGRIQFDVQGATNQSLQDCHVQAGGNFEINGSNGTLLCVDVLVATGSLFRVTNFNDLQVSSVELHENSFFHATNFGDPSVLTIVTQGKLSGGSFFDLQNISTNAQIVGFELKTLSTLRMRSAPGLGEALEISVGGTIIWEGGNFARVSKKFASTLDLGLGFTHSDIYHWSGVGQTLTASNVVAGRDFFNNSLI